MHTNVSLLALLLAGLLRPQLSAHGSPAPEAVVSAPPRSATLQVRAGERSRYGIPRFLTGKFAEHLGNNIYNGMDAQILRNPTFADYPFATGQTTPDGVATFHFDREIIDRELRQRASRLGWPEAELSQLIESRNDGLACWWSRWGPKDSGQWISLGTRCRSYRSASHRAQ